MILRKTFVHIAAMSLLASCGGNDSTGDPVDDSSETTAEAEPMADAGPASDGGQPAAVAQCVACHTFDEAGPNGIGPNLWNVYNSPAASKPGFMYSTAMKESGFTWDDATLDTYLANPRTALPGGKMSFAGISDEAKRKEVITYLATLEPVAVE